MGQETVHIISSVGNLFQVPSKCKQTLINNNFVCTKRKVPLVKHANKTNFTQLGVLPPLLWVETYKNRLLCVFLHDRALCVICSFLP